MYFFRDETGRNSLIRSFITGSIKRDLEEWETVEWTDLARDAECCNKC